ncbi:agmatinase [Histidinibacterium aquaticum]|uniref:Agmatinase n=1 Tax=Histidinibacterium aquaticum TaxID=2613962 RepID=A0A5J5GPL9_9RHOB|nr:agmatinase [Histidinibacterium aquaticum]KAA9009382.1 agmatinase [Histidinibacterium aquaticum]
MALEDAKTQVDLAFTGKGEGAAHENTFGGATSFLRRRYTKDVTGADLVVTGVPFDQAVTNRPGTRFGPRAIREASALLPYDPPHGWGFQPLDFRIVDAGDVAFDYANVPETPGRIEAHAAGLIAGGAPLVTLGGDHFVTLPLLKAFAAKYGPMSVIQFDAHSDLWADDDMGRIDHGTFMYKAVKLGLVEPSRSVQIGIRTVCEDTLGVHQIDARRVHERSADWAAAQIKEVVGGAPCYLTFDIDALDPAFAPGTGTPVWGGLASWQAAAVLRDLAGIDLKGGDVMEVSPPYDSGGITAVAGAHVALELCCLALWSRAEIA